MANYGPYSRDEDGKFSEGGSGGSKGKMSPKQKAMEQAGYKVQKAQAKYDTMLDKYGLDDYATTEAEQALQKAQSEFDSAARGSGQVKYSKAAAKDVAIQTVHDLRAGGTPIGKIARQASAITRYETGHKLKVALVKDPNPFGSRGAENLGTKYKPQNYFIKISGR